MNLSGFLKSLFTGSHGPVVVQPTPKIEPPRHRPLILPESGDVILPGGVEVIGCVKQPRGHRLHLSTPRGTLYLDAELPAAWWTGENKAKFQRQYAAQLYAERHLRGTSDGLRFPESQDRSGEAPIMEGVKVSDENKPPEFFKGLDH